MRTRVLGVILLFAVQTASAAIQYDFRQTVSSDAEGSQAVDCSGSAVIDGEKSRIEFTNCNAYPAGSFILTTNGSRMLTFVDPTKKTFADVNAAAVATAIGSAKITVSNKKVSTTEMPDHPNIAGLPTNHFRLTLDYDITVTFGTMPLTQTIHTMIDRWTTMSFGDVAETFLSSGAVRTGNPDLDDLIAAESAKDKGFPLRQIIRTTAVNNRAQAVKSELQVSHSVTVTRELVLNSVQPVAKVADVMFIVPAGFHRADPVKDDTQKAPVQMLTMQPSNP
jgi:hypothetical protein